MTVIIDRVSEEKIFVDKHPESRFNLETLFILSNVLKDSEF